jgi:hypothetical protein
MKKQMKKLGLAKETVRRLEDLELGEVGGGGTWQPSCTEPAESGLWICRLVPTIG